MLQSAADDGNYYLFPSYSAQENRSIEEVKLMKCPACGFENSDNRKYCERCKQSLSPIHLPETQLSSLSQNWDDSTAVEQGNEPRTQPIRNYHPTEKKTIPSLQPQKITSSGAALDEKTVPQSASSSPHLNQTRLDRPPLPNDTRPTPIPSDSSDELAATISQKSLSSDELAATISQKSLSSDELAATTLTPAPHSSDTLTTTTPTTMTNDSAPTIVSTTQREEKKINHAPTAPLNNEQLLRPLPKPELQDFRFAPRASLPPLWRRLAAGIIDFFLISLLSFFITIIFNSGNNKVFPSNLHGLDLLATFLHRYSQQILVFFIIFSIVYFLYSALFLALFGWSPGKKLLALTVIDRSGRPIGWLGSVARSLAFLLFFFLGFIGCSWILVDKEFRGLHDRVAGSLVILSQKTSKKR